MKHFVLMLYAALYTAIAGSFLIVEVASIKVGWMWISTLVHPMGVLFLVINVPLACIGVIKAAHVVFLHSVKHHKNVMRSIREMDAIPSPTTGIQPQKIQHGGTLSHKSTSGGTLIDSVPLSQSVPQKMATTPDDFNVTVRYYLSQYPHASIREVERATGIPKSNIGRTSAWQNRAR